MSYTKILLLTVATFCFGALNAQHIVVDTIVETDTVQRQPIVHTDTFKIQDANVIDWTDEDMLLEMLALQRREQMRRDSLIQDSLAKREVFVHDSLVADLLYRESMMQIMQMQIRDSLDMLLADFHAKRAYEDSLARAEYMRDSIARQIAMDKANIQVELTPSLIKDPAEDAKERERLKKLIYSPWRKDATVQIQFAQNYNSPNWYQGGNKLNFNLISLLKGNINYSKNNIVWENLGEWRAGIANAPGDTIRKYTVTDDLFRIYSKFGYQVVKKLYISSSVEFKTNFWNIWKTNTNDRKTTFLTPMRLSIDVGLDYKPVNGLSVVVSPLSYKMVYAMLPDKVPVTSLGIEEGKDIMNDVGSSFRLKWQWKPMREIELNTEFYVVYTYLKKTVEVDWQTDCNFIFNRFFSARVSLHPRYNSNEKTDGKAKIQFKELISIGFAHKFN